MPKKPIAVEKQYALAEGPVRLSVLVGDRQYGSSIVFLDDELLANGDIEELPIGNGSDLDGRELVVYTVVTDVRSKKHEMSVTWILTGGEKTVTVEKSASVSKSFGSQMFKAVFELAAGD